MCSPIVIGVVQNLLFVYNVIPAFYHNFLGAISERKGHPFGVNSLLNPFLLKQPYRGNGTNRPKTAIRTRRTMCFTLRQQSATGIGLERIPLSFRRAARNLNN